jgi:hypothetical protein
MLNECSLNVHWMFTKCSLKTGRVGSRRVLRDGDSAQQREQNDPRVHVHCVNMFTEISLNAHWMFTECSLNVHWKQGEWVAAEYYGMGIRHSSASGRTLRSGCTLFLTRVSLITASLSTNDSRGANASAQRKGQPVDMRYPAHSQFSLFAKRTIFQNNWRSLSTRMLSLGIHADYHWRWFLPVLGASTEPASASGSHKLFWDQCVMKYDKLFLNTPTHKCEFANAVRNAWMYAFRFTKRIIRCVLVDGFLVAGFFYNRFYLERLF